MSSPTGLLDSQVSDLEDAPGQASSLSQASSSRKHSSRGPTTSRPGSSHRDSSRSSRRHEHNRAHSAGETGMPDHAAPGVSLPSTSRAAGNRDVSPAPPWNVVLDAIAELRSEVNKLKEGKCSGGVGGGGVAVPTNSVDAGRPVFTSAPPSTAEFSGFPADEHYISSEDDEGDTVNDQQSVSVLQRCAKVYGPVDAVAAEIDGRVADMVNYVFDNGLREEEYKEILEDDATKRPSNCEALSPVECNAQVLDALKPDAKKTDLRMKGVGKDIVMAATILTKSLTVLDNFA